MARSFNLVHAMLEFVRRSEAHCPEPEGFSVTVQFDETILGRLWARSFI
jgi:hypothetical protein